jgi:hypothetical protein
MARHVDPFQPWQQPRPCSAAQRARLGTPRRAAVTAALTATRSLLRSIHPWRTTPANAAFPAAIGASDAELARLARATLPRTIDDRLRPRPIHPLRLW